MVEPKWRASPPPPTASVSVGCRHLQSKHLPWVRRSFGTQVPAAGDPSKSRTGVGQAKGLAGDVPKAFRGYRGGDDLEKGGLKLGDALLKGALALFQVVAHWVGQIEYPALKPLPAKPYEFAEWKKCRPGLDYHVEIDKHYYSVPYTLIRQEMWARYTAQMVEVLHRDKRIAAHMRSYVKRAHTTLPEHMPSSHRRYRDWTLERITHEANAIGPHTSTLVAVILRERPHPEQGFRSCRGILNLAASYDRERLEAACERALIIGTRSFKSVKSILNTRLDRKRPEQAADGPAITHNNIRGTDYYH